MSDKSNKKQIEWEKNGGTQSGKDEYRNYERGTTTRVIEHKLKELIKEENKNK